MEKSREEKLLEEVYSHNERAPARWRALHELNVIAAERAGASTHFWTIVGAVAAIIAALLAFAAWLWPIR